DSAGLWDELKTDWAILDCELMPWSAKAQDLLRRQYAAVGAAASATLPAAVSSLQAAAERGLDVAGILEHYRSRKALANRYIETSRLYFWPVPSLDDFKLAPFHLLATEGKAHIDRDHVWHLETLNRLCRADPTLLLATSYLLVDVTHEASR